MENPKRSNPPASTVPASEFPALASIRSQAAFVRSLLDEVERLAPAGGAEGAVGAQLVEELARLGARFLEVSRALQSPEPPISKCA